MITATATAAPTLHGRVEVLSDLGGPGRVRVRTLGDGVGGWAQAGRELTVDANMLSDIRDTEARPVEETAPAVVAAPADDTALTGPINGDDYMAVLLRRQELWLARHGGSLRFPPLLDWFVRDADVPHVIVPETAPQPKKVTTPRVYKTAESLRAERDKVAAEMDRVASADEAPDRAMANLSPYSRNKAAARAGRARFAKLDRDLERFAALRERLDALNGRIARAETREAKRRM